MNATNPVTEASSSVDAKWRRDTLITLATKAKNLIGPDRTIDAEIECAVLFPDLRPAKPEYYPGYAAGDILCSAVVVQSLAYTRCVDSALLLIPPAKNWRWCLGPASNGNGFRAEVSVTGVPEPITCEVWAVLPAIALTTAALLARAKALSVPLPNPEQTGSRL